MPRSPISDPVQTGMVARGVVLVPSKRFSAPPFSVIRRSPFGRKAIAVGPERPVTYGSSVKPVGGVPATASRGVARARRASSRRIGGGPTQIPAGPSIPKSRAWRRTRSPYILVRMSKTSGGAEGREVLSVGGAQFVIHRIGALGERASRLPFSDRKS